MTNRPPPQLTDSQKGDLAQLWERHAPTQTITLSNPTSSRGGRGGRGRGRGRGGGGSSSGVAPTTVVTMEMGDEEYTQICRLYAFFRWVLSSNCSQRQQQQQTGEVRTVTPDASSQFGHNNNSRTRQSLMYLFEQSNTTHDSRSNSIVVQNDNNLMTPKIRGGNLVISFNHSLFIQELTDYEAQSSQNNNEQSIQFAPYLHRYPDRAIACIGCAIGIIILSAWRQNQPSSIQPRPNPTLETAIYKPRFYNLAPSNQIRMAHIRTSTVDCLISLRGTVTKARPKRLRVLDAGFTCCKCGINQICRFVDGKYSTPTRCEDMKCRSTKFSLVRKVANFCDVQELRIQEVREEFCEDLETGDGGMGHGDGNRESGRAPRHMEVEVSNDLVDQCHAGDSIVVVGVVRAVNSALASGRGGKRAEETSTYKLYVVAHSIVNLTADDTVRGGQGTEDLQSGNEQGQNRRQKTSASASGIDWSDQQLQQLNNIAHADHLMYSIPTRQAFPFDLLVRSLCPSIIGNDLVKAGMILCLLGGTPPQVSGLEAQSGMTIRSNSHCLIVGDPGMGKSQMLLSANQVASRSVYVGGNTASSTGLTVSLTKESGGDMGIEAGALVLADRGICCLDELDKMPKAHQDGLLEAMEQQQVSIAKAGVVATLPSRCSVIAAANPKSGHYNLSKSVAENLNMAGPLLSRFDLVFILRDEADAKRDKLISGSIMGRFNRGPGHNHEYNDVNNQRNVGIEQYMEPEGRIPLKHRLPWVADFQKQPLPMEQVKDYIAYAREYCKPQMSTEASAVLQDHFMNLRLNSSKDSVPITTRQLEALIRLSQARAKACLRQIVLKEDAEDVVELMQESMKQVHMDETGQIDKGRGGVRGKSKQNRLFLEAMSKSGRGRFTFIDLQAIAEKIQIDLNGFNDFVETLRSNGDILRTAEGCYALAS